MSKRRSTKVVPLPATRLSQNAEQLLHILPSGVIVVTRAGVVRYANAAAEDFLGSSLAALEGKELSHFVYPATHLLELVEAAFAGGALIKEYDFTLAAARGVSRNVNLQIQPMDDRETALIVIDDRGMADKLSQHMRERGSARSASGMASILAHEVKNPLSGIRGAAQLLQKTVSPNDRELTTLICNEVDRIKDVIEEMEIFSNPSKLKTERVNIHEVLQYVRTLAEKGMASHVQFREVYDPSIPDVTGHRNLLIQLFINIIKNAVEAIVNTDDSIITITTSYQSGFRIKKEGSEISHSLPIVVTIEDNGPGIPTELRESIFDPFVTTKEGGKGLGLAIVAKIIADHGGAIELEDAKEGTRFKILLPAA